MMRMSRRAAILTGLAAACAKREPGLTDTIFELRDYTLRPSRRDALIALFEREFVESQEAVGARIVGTFRDLDAPDHFIWMRSFADMAARRNALTAFYGGPVWRAHREAANATMIDSDNVYLLHLVGAALRLPAHRPPPGSSEPSAAIFVADIFASPENERDYRSRAAKDERVIARFATERSPNNFPSLPVRPDIVFVTLRRFEQTQGISPIATLPPPSRTIRLAPTPRSLLR
jgi:hypothetical protein